MVFYNNIVIGTLKMNAVACLEINPSFGPK